MVNATPVDTSVIGFKSDRQDAIFRHRKKPQVSAPAAQHTEKDAFTAALPDQYPIPQVEFLSDLLDAAEYQRLLACEKNFAVATQVDCLHVDADRAEFLCQHPRWSVHAPNFVQKAPVSVYMRNDLRTNLTVSMVVGEQKNHMILKVKSVLELALRATVPRNLGSIPVKDPFDIHCILSAICCEDSKGHIHSFRQSMFEQLRTVDELTAQETADRHGLAAVTIELQIVSKDVNKLISDADVAIQISQRLRAAYQTLQDALPAPSLASASSPSASRQATMTTSVARQATRLANSIDYLTSSMEKQKMWLLNYRDRKDIAMSLVFNLVTQQDAANNISIARDMRRDSSSMNSIALLTMIFLPGTFTSTVLGAGLFSAVADKRDIKVNGIWWLWAATTLPLTAVTLASWKMYHWHREGRMEAKLARARELMRVIGLRRRWRDAEEGKVMVAA
ncbi:MAG: hypothetical protein M1832_000934 [Thelocarpon impressellum]|nr:MAG: hypothetical protein M1832_000934 [Thelocarpon impressellum]